MKKCTYIDAVNEALAEEMERDSRVFVIGEDVDVDGGVWNETVGLIERYGKKRVVGTPISEAGFTGLAAGAALAGLRPVVEFMYLDFVHVAMDQIASQIAKARLMFGNQASMPVVLRMCACGAGTREAAQHSQHLEAWFAHLPGFQVVMPATAADGKGLMKSAIRSDNPVVFIESRNIYYDKQEVPEGEYTVPIGAAEVVRAGSDITLITAGYARYKALEAAARLEGELSIEVIDLRTVKPLDMETVLASVAKTGRVVVAHDAPVVCGIGAELVRRIVEEGFDFLDAPPRVVASKDVPVPFSEVLEDYVILHAEDIVRVLREIY
jgi:pyruvate/2-oxoglutarate/acetoin dehydrogenase E1 component